MGRRTAAGGPGLGFWVWGGRRDRVFRFGRGAAYGMKKAGSWRETGFGLLPRLDSNQ